MKAKIEKEIKDLQSAWANGCTGMNVNEYTTTLHILYKKLQSIK